MRKFYAFLAAALMSVSVFASKDVVPSDEVLADYFTPGQVCACIFVPADMVCNDIVFTGTFNGWSDDLAKCEKFVNVEGYDGWYVVAVNDTTTGTDGYCGKPILLDGDGKFNWDYQIGAASYIRGGVQVVEGAYEGEIDLKHYSSDVPNVYTVDAWKKNPCDAVYHNYKFTVISDGCDGYVVPFIVGSFTGWKFTQMQYDEARSAALEADVYVLTLKAAEESQFQYVSGLWNDEGEVGVMPDWNKAESYLQVLQEDGSWIRMPGESGDNLLTKEDPEILLDVRAENLRWARCAPAEDPEIVTFAVKLPSENCPEAVEVIGTFDGWAGTALTWNPSTGFAEATFEAKPSDYFKFRTAGIWPPEGQEIELYDTVDDGWRTIKDNELVFSKLWEDAAEGKSLVLDFSDPEMYRWSGSEQGIENITLTEKAQKVVVDGVLYIVRDNKMFNVQGTQVR